MRGDLNNFDERKRRYSGWHHWIWKWFASWYLFDVSVKTSCEHNLVVTLIEMPFRRVGIHLYMTSNVMSVGAFSRLHNKEKSNIGQVANFLPEIWTKSLLSDILCSSRVFLFFLLNSRIARLLLVINYWESNAKFIITVIIKYCVVSTDLNILIRGYKHFKYFICINGKRVIWCKLINVEFKCGTVQCKIILKII